MTRIGCVVQARMGSTRLPGKSMMLLAGKPLLFRVLQRIRRVSVLDEVVLATSNLAQDDVLFDLAREMDIPVVRGSENNVADRYVRAIKEFGFDVVVRIPADNYLTEEWAIDLLIEEHLKFRTGFTTNIMEVQGSGFPDGLGGEAFEASEFLALHTENCASYKDEHVHRHYYSYSEEDNHLLHEGKVRTCICPNEYSFPRLRFDINTMSDYAFAVRLFDALGDNECRFGFPEVLKWLKSQ